MNNGAGAADAYGAGNKGSERMSLGVHRLIGPRVTGSGEVTLSSGIGNVYFPALPGTPTSSFYSVMLTGHTSTVPYVSYLLAPTMVSATAVAGGSLTSGTEYFYKITATNVNGETTVSNEENATPSGSNLSVTLVWDADNGAAGYNIYRGTTTGVENVLVAKVGAVTTYTDVGGTVTSLTPPGSNTANSFTPTSFIVTGGTTDTVFWTVVKQGIWGSLENDGPSSVIANT